MTEPVVAAEALPTWDMTVVYPSLESPEFVAGFQETVNGIAALGALFDGHGVGAGPARTADGVTVAAFEEVLGRLNEVLAQVETLDAYLTAFVTTDSRNALAQARASELTQRTVQLSQLQTRFVAWVGTLDLPSLFAQSALARAHAFPLEEARLQARHQMSPAEEDLAAGLNPAAGDAWARLHGDLTSQISVAIELGGTWQELPMSAIRNLALDPDREVRRRAYAAELAAWERAALPLAAAMNGIKGQVLTLSARRGWDTPLDQALFASRIDRATLTAMIDATREAFPEFRRYLHVKARVLGVPALAWYDLFAPVGEATGDPDRWTWAAAREFIVDRFGAYSDRLSAFAARAFRERWIDAPPLPGKRDGAFCMSLRGDESRILANYQPSYDGVSTLAHELGHGYHNLNEAGLTPLQRETPMTLAETASIFCETIIREAALADADEAEQFAILEASLQGSCQVTVDILSRFLFEETVFARRRERDLAVEELNELMLDAQRQTYGDGLDPAALHSYMWAVKGHYYSVGRSYYNFPYLFGQLFGLGLYARYRADPEQFRAQYDALLASTGRADAPTLAARFGIDLRSPDFWRASLGQIVADIDRFAALVVQRAGSPAAD